MCGLCDRFVQFVIKKDPAGNVRFAALQSETGKALLRKFGLSEHELSFVVFLEGEEIWIKSAAVLRTMKYLEGGWRALAFLRTIPAPVSDIVYDFIARHRYSWFGKYDQCIIPSPDTKVRFLS